MKKTYYLIVLPILLLQGCSTIKDSKTILVTPEKGQSKVVIESVTTARCKNIIGIITCDISIDLHQARQEGDQVTTPNRISSQQTLVTIPTKTSAQPSADNRTVTNNGTPTARLKQLDELIKSGLISKDEYKQKRQTILKEL